MYGGAIRGQQQRDELFMRRLFPKRLIDRPPGENPSNAMDLNVFARIILVEMGRSFTPGAGGRHKRDIELVCGERRDFVGSPGSLRVGDRGYVSLNVFYIPSRVWPDARNLSVDGTPIRSID